MGQRKERQGQILEHKHGEAKKERRRDGEIKWAECSDQNLISGVGVWVCVCDATFWSLE